MAYALRPELFVEQTLWVDVDTSGGLMHGATVSGAPSYRRLGLQNTLTGRPEHSSLEIKATQQRPITSSAKIGREINVPSDVDGVAIVDWYEQLLGN
jgi:inosine-uridine nucleoside N-ribohydrolase